MIREGPIPQNRLPRILGLMGAPKTGKTSLAASCIRACPEWFGTKGIYVEIDPDGSGSMLHADRPNWERVTLDSGKYLKDELMEVVKHPWEKEGVGTVLIDTMSVWSEELLAQIAQLSMFGNNVDIKGIKHPSPGDYSAVDKAIFNVLNEQKARSQKGGPVFLTLFHEHTIEPEAAKPGETFGGPRLAGKKVTDKVVGWYNFMARIAMRPLKRTNLAAPQEYERVLYTATNGIWRAGIRTGDESNPMPETAVPPSRINVWQQLEKHLNPLTPKSI